MITIKTKKEIETMRGGGRILAKMMEDLKKEVVLGKSSKELNRVAETLFLKYKTEPAFLGYGGFSAVLCVCVNNIIVHAVPSEYRLKEGDVVSLDLGIKHKGFYLDMAFTLAMGKVDFEALRMLKTTKKALKLGIQKARQGNTFGDIGNTIQRFVEYQGFNVVRDLCGHGIGKQLHEDPKILNYGKRHAGEQIKEGMVFCIEPMVTMGDWHLKKSQDGFGYETVDGSLTCHFEHTVAVSKSGCQILTKL